MAGTGIARKFLGVLEPIVSMIFFAPEANEEYQGVGIDPIAGYFCSRSAAMGRASGDLVASAFFNFNPVLVKNALRWETVDPADVLAARARASRRALTRLLADEDGALPDVSRAVALLRAATGACRPEGRPLFAAHAGLAWPEEELEALWHGANLLREYRGDGHIAALVSHGIDAVEAIVLHVPYLDAKKDFLYGSRMWGDEAYLAAVARLAARGFLTAEGAITDGGRKFREMLEMETDRLAMAPFAALGAERSEELLGLLRPLSARILERKGLPGGIARAASSN